MIHKTTRSILSVLLAALLLVTSVPLTPAFAGGGAVSPQSANSERGGLEGSGKEGDPYKIATAKELWDFAKLVNGGKTDAWAVLTADIDLSGICSEESDTSWTPIGNSSNNQYTGTFNGQNFKISGLTINNSSANYQGLFGYVDTGGIVQNLSVSGSVKGDDYVGGVVGDNRGSVEDCDFTGSVSGNSYVGGVVGVVGVVGDSSGSVKNCYNTGAVSSLDSGSGNSVGGVVGYNDIGGSVTNCYNTGSVNGSIEAGGVVGSNSLSATVTNCYNTGEVSGMYVGGVVGYNDGPVKNCYNTGSVSGKISVGGVVGQNLGGPVENCYNIGEVSGPDSGSGSNVGGVVGYNGVSGSVTNCYFLKTDDVNKDLQGIGNNEDAEGAAAVNDLNELCKALEYDTDTWTTSPFYNHPVLQENPEGGDGTKEHPYEIKTAAQLKTFRDIVNGANRQVKDSDAHAKLMNDIDLEGSETNQWTPIGNSEENAYTGTFNGNGNTISGLTINDSNADDQGLFGYLSTDGGNIGTVKDLSVSGSVSGHFYVGGVVGYNNGGTVTGCIFSGSGSVSVTGSYYVGGVVGDNRGSVENCYNTGKVSGLNSVISNVGGVVGDNGGTVINCYNTGEVSGPDSVNGETTVNVGGVVGYNNGTVKNCYNTGSVSDGTYTGGVVGYNDSNGNVTGCYYQIDKGATVGIGNETTADTSKAEGKTDAQFASGEVAYLLEKGVTDEKPVWGQDLTDKNSLPTLVALDKANAQKVYRLTFNWNMGDQQPDTVRYTNGSVTLPADNEIPTRTGYHISGWKDKNGKPVTAETTVEEDAVFTAEWTANTYTITVTAGSGGTVSGSGEYSEGTEVTVTATPATGYHFVNWTENGTEVSTSATYSFTATANRTFAADAVEPDPEPTPEPEPEEPPYTGKYSYEVSTSVGDHGTLAVDRYATEGEKVTIEVAPDQAYKLDDLSVTAHGKDVELTANGDGTYTFTMPSADVRITATFAEDPDWTEPEEPATDVSDLFSDIAPDAWYKDAVQYAYAGGLMTGVSATEFAPEATTTRAMIVSILARLENVTTAEAAGFADVDDNDWYATAVNWAANVGVVNGYEDNTFRPNTAITREQLAAILMNYANYKGQDVSARASLDNYTDQPSTWAEETMQWAVAEGLISGVTADTLQPQGAATRAQVAAILQRFLSE